MLQVVNNNTDQEYFQKLEVDVLAKTIWGEARGQSIAVKDAIANVVLNRVKIAEQHGRYWWGNSIIAVCQKAYQFHCWTRTSPIYKEIVFSQPNNKEYMTCVDIAVDAIDREILDNTHGATHYHRVSEDPYWAKGEKPTAIIDGFKFYKLVG